MKTLGALNLLVALSLLGCDAEEMPVESCDTDACDAQYPPEETTGGHESGEESGGSGGEAVECRAAKDEAACGAASGEYEGCGWLPTQVFRYDDGVCEMVEDRGICVTVSMLDEGCEWFPSSSLACEQDSEVAYIRPAFELDGAFEVLPNPESCSDGDIPWAFTACDSDSADMPAACACAC
ncbi:MAG: hypothetical protein AAF721_04550 [Myxococcota bacterium]